jgi:hypothetical protein
MTNDNEGYTDEHTIYTQTTHHTTETSSANGDKKRNFSTQSANYSTQSTNEHHRNFISVNDGTLRITIRWKPTHYDTIHEADDEEEWAQGATKMIQEIFSNPTAPILLVAWQDTAMHPTSILNIHSLKPKELHKYRSPKVSNLASYKMYVFGIRICSLDTTFSTGTWLKNPTIKEALTHNGVSLNISNSTCDSGNMVNAGVILLKHPTYTHRLYFLLALRRHLPPNTPFFDIGIHQKTHNGIDSPHLVIKCGENHQDSLTQILSDFLDGKQTTALYIGTKYLRSITQEAAEELFDMHQKYVNSIVRLQLSPTL